MARRTRKTEEPQDEEASETIPDPVPTENLRFCPTCGRSELGHHWLKQGDMSDAIVDGIGQVDQLWALNKIIEAITDRGRELGFYEADDQA